MTRKQRFPPPLNLRNPAIQKQKSRNPTNRKYRKEQHDESPWCDTQLWRVEFGEWDPCADVYETSAVEDEVYYGGEDFVFDLGVEVAVPGDCYT